MSSIDREVTRILEGVIGDRTIALVGPSVSSSQLRAFLGRIAPTSSVDDPAHNEACTSISYSLAALDMSLRKPGLLLLERLASLGPPPDVVLYGGSFPTTSSCGPYEVIGARSTVPANIESKAVQYSLLPSEVLPPYHRCPRRRAESELPRIASTSSVVLHAATLPVEASMAAAGVRFVHAGSTREHCEKILGTFPQEVDDLYLCRFAPGWPVTIYGYVAESDGVVSGVYEALNDADIDDGRLFASGVRGADLPADILSAIRETGLVTALQVSTALTYRGGFCIDGTWDGERYVIFDINLRSCAGARRFGADIDLEVPPALIDLTIRESSSSEAQSVIEMLQKRIESHASPRYRELSYWDRPDPVKAEGEWTPQPPRIPLRAIPS